MAWVVNLACGTLASIAELAVVPGLGCEARHPFGELRSRGRGTTASSAVEARVPQASFTARAPQASFAGEGTRYPRLGSGC